MLMSKKRQMIHELRSLKYLFVLLTLFENKIDLIIDILSTYFPWNV